MKWHLFTLYILGLPLLALQCNRDLPYTPMPPIDPNPPLHFIQTSVPTWTWTLGTLPGQTTMVFAKDTIFSSDTFYLIEVPGWGWPKTEVTFRYMYNVQETLVKSVSWKIGAERQNRIGEAAIVEFVEPAIIPVTCVVSRQIMKRGYAQPLQTDTLRDTLYLKGLSNALPIRYKGVNSDNLLDTFEIEFGYGTEPQLPLFQSEPFLYLSNLPKGYPFKHAGYLQNNLVGFQDIVGWRRPQYQGLYTSLMKGFGKTTKGIDSIYITQTFAVNTVNEDNENRIGRTLHFKGKRVQ